MRRVTNGFDARKLCDRRRYEYIAPAFVFDPTACRERQWYYAEANAQRAAAAAVKAGSARKTDGAAAQGDSAAVPVPGLDAEATAPPGLGAAAADDADETADALLADVADASGQTEAPQADGAMAVPPQEGNSTASVANGSHAEQAAAGPSRAKDEAGQVAHPAPGSSSDMGSPDFKFDQACAERLSAILQQYEGTHSFHNFTVKVPVGSPEARRFIVRFRCEGTFELEVSPCTPVHHITVGHYAAATLHSKLLPVSTASLSDARQYCDQRGRSAPAACQEHGNKEQIAAPASQWSTARQSCSCAAMLLRLHKHCCFHTSSSSCNRVWVSLPGKCMMLVLPQHGPLL